MSRQESGIDRAPVAALSVLPRSARPLLDLPPIGREADLDWLIRTREDRILVGQPGSGKTYLLRRLTMDPEARAFFVVDRDRAALANAIRDLQPRIVIVDDAFEDPEFLRTLRSLRDSVQFSIVAATWPYRLRELKAELEISDQHVRHLEGMTRRELAALYRAAGVDAREDILVELVRQARNKPGLAATLIRSWRASDYRSIASGEALMTSLAPALRRIAGVENPALLGVLALGGRSGVALDRAARYLEMPIGEARRIAGDLSAAGILEIRADEALVVVPEEVASAALASAFLGDIPIPGWQQFAESLDDKTAVLDALLQAAEAGSPVRFELLLDWVRRFGNRQNRQRFADLSDSHADAASTAFPDHFLELVPSLLARRTRPTIRRLLELVRPPAPPENTVEALLGEGPPTALGLLGDWVAEGHTDPEFASRRTLERRTVLFEEVERFLRQGGNRHGAAEALLLVFGSTLRHSEKTLENQRLVTTLLLADSEIPVRAWESLLAISDDLGPDFWNCCRRLLERISSAFRRASTKQVGRSWQTVGRRIIDALRNVISPGSVEASQLKLAAKDLGIRVELPTDRVLDGLLDWHIPFRNAVARLVQGLKKLEPGEQVSQLLRYADILGEGPSPGGKVATAARQLAGKSSDPLHMLEIWLAREAPASWASPLLDVLASMRPAGWVQRLASLLPHPAYSVPAAVALLSHEGPPGELLEASLAVLRRHPHETFRLSQAPISVVERLLLEEGPVSQWAIENEWFRQDEPRPELANVWADAVSRSSYEGAEHVLEEIWAERPDLLRRWLTRYAWIPVDRGAEFSPRALEAISKLDEQVRLEVVGTLHPSCAEDDLIQALVGSSSAIYRALLQRSELNDFALAPLASLPDRDWAALAAVALDETDFDERIVALAAFSAVTVFDPRNAAVWAPFLEAFEKLEAEVPAMAGLAAMGVEAASLRMDEAKKKQRLFEMTGSPFPAR